MRRVFAKGSIAIAVAMLAWYLASPYVALYRMVAATNARDATLLNSYIDFGSLRESLHNHVNVATLKVLTDTGAPLADFAALLGGALAKSAVDTMISPEGVSVIMSGRLQLANGSSGSPDASRIAFSDYSLRRIGLSTFVARRTTDNDSTAVGLVFTRDFPSWRLSAIELPIGVADQLAQAPARPAQPEPDPSLRDVKQPFPPREGPFGLAIGIPRSELEQAFEITEQGDNALVTKTVPRPHSAFDSYTLIVDDVVGLCKISAIGKDITTSAFGDKVRDEFASIKASLTEKYGKPSTSFDFVRAGSMWDKPNFWMMSLRSEDRTLVAYWLRDKGAPLPQNVSAIGLRAHALSTEKGYLTLGYEFENFSVCVESAKNKGRDAL